MSRNVVTKAKVKIEDHVPEQIKNLPRRNRRALNALIDRVRKRSIFKTLADLQCPDIKSKFLAGVPVVHKIRQSVAIFQMREAVVYLTDVITHLCEVYHHHLEILFLTPANPNDKSSRNTWKVRASYRQDNVIIFGR